jgi:hypothetical protein
MLRIRDAQGSIPSMKKWTKKQRKTHSVWFFFLFWGAVTWSQAFSLS